MPLTDATLHRVEAIPDDRGAMWAVVRFGSPAARIGLLTEAKVAPKAMAVEVYVNEGRWVAECPDCNGAQLACKTDHRFMCNECGNVAIEGRWRPVVWPTNAAALARILEPRLPLNQHWRPGETVADLRRENREHGLVGR